MDATMLPEDCDLRIRQLRDYWQAIHPADGVLPGRQHIDPIDIPRLLPWLWLVDVQRPDMRFKFRLIGTEQVLLHGRDLTGRWVDESYPDFGESALGRAAVAAADDGATFYYRGGPMLRTTVEVTASEWLVLPLARDGTAVDMLLALSVHQSPHRPDYR